MNEDMKLILDEIRGLKGEMGDIKAEIVDMKSEVTGMKTEITGMKTEIAATKDEIKAAEERLNAKIAAQREDTLSAFSTLGNAVEDIAKKIDSMENITGRNMYDIAVLKQRYA